MRPLAIDLCTGLSGWGEGLIAEGWRVIGFDIEDMFAALGETKPDHFNLVLQDIQTLHGAQFADADLIVASPPCQEFSYMAMPWSRGKQIARALRGDDEFPDGYKGSRTIAELTALFAACFRIQREACEAAGRHIPMVVENVRGAQPWVGRAAWNFGSYYLWGDLPALMPAVTKAGTKVAGMKWYHPSDPRHVPGQGFNTLADRAAREGLKVPGFRFDGSGKSFQTASVTEGRKGAGAGAAWFDGNLCVKSSKSSARKAASARIAKIPFALSSWVARVYRPAIDTPPGKRSLPGSVGPGALSAPTRPWT